MLKHIFTFVTIISFSILSAQSDTTNIKPMSKDRYEKARKRLKLTPEQEAKLKEIHQKRKIEVERRREENRLFRENMRKRTESEVDQVLTPEQQAEYDKMKEERKEKMKEKQYRKAHSRGKWHRKEAVKEERGVDTTKR